MKNRTAMLVLAGAVVFASSIGALAGCLSLNGGGGFAADSTPSPTFSAGLGTSEATPEATPSVAAVHETPKQTPKKTTTTPPPAHETGPVIKWFRVTKQPECPRGTTEYPVEGVPVTLSWKVTGADKVTLSVDGDGIYNTYPTEGSETLNFPCGGNPGDTVTHTYLLKTVGGGQVKSKKLSVSAEVHEITQV